MDVENFGMLPILETPEVFKGLQGFLCMYVFSGAALRAKILTRIPQSGAPGDLHIYVCIFPGRSAGEFVGLFWGEYKIRREAPTKLGSLFGTIQKVSYTKSGAKRRGILGPFAGTIQR